MFEYFSIYSINPHLVQGFLLIFPWFSQDAVDLHSFIWFSLIFQSIMWCIPIFSMVFPHMFMWCSNSFHVFPHLFSMSSIFSLVMSLGFSPYSTPWQSMASPAKLNPDSAPLWPQLPAGRPARRAGKRPGPSWCSPARYVAETDRRKSRRNSVDELSRPNIQQRWYGNWTWMWVRPNIYTYIYIYIYI